MVDSGDTQTWVQVLMVPLSDFMTIGHSLICKLDNGTAIFYQN